MNLVANRTNQNRNFFFTCALLSFLMIQTAFAFRTDDQVVVHAPEGNLRARVLAVSEDQSLLEVMLIDSQTAQWVAAEEVCAVTGEAAPLPSPSYVRVKRLEACKNVGRVCTAVLAAFSVLAKCLSSQEVLAPEGWMGQYSFPVLAFATDCALGTTLFFTKLHRNAIRAQQNDLENELPLHPRRTLTVGRAIPEVQSEDVECPICFNNTSPDRVWVALPCDHLLCSKCYEVIRDGSCAVCTRPIPLSGPVPVVQIADPVKQQEKY